MSKKLTFLRYLRGIFNTNLKPDGTVHYAIIQSIYDLFVMAEDDINLMRLEMCLAYASGFWLDCWGKFFGIPRKNQETDVVYRNRIIYTIVRPKNTKPAIQEWVAEHINNTLNANYLPSDVVIKEPWKDIAKYNHFGTLNGTARFSSTGYYTHATIDIVLPTEVELTKAIKDLVKAVKAAGVNVLWGTLTTFNGEINFTAGEDEQNFIQYLREYQIYVKEHFNGLILSNSSNYKALNGIREFWRLLTSYYYFYVYVEDKKTDESIIITKQDLVIALIDYYTNSDGEDIKITEEMILDFEQLEDYLKVNQLGQLSTSSGIIFKYIENHELFSKLLEQLEEFKKNTEVYYNSLQPPITRQEILWLVPRNKNWLWDTPLMTYEDFFTYYEPYKEEEHTINGIVKYEVEQEEEGFLTFGDPYEPPIVTSSEYYAVKLVKNWLWDTPLMTYEDFFTYYEPYKEEEHTITSIFNYEIENENGYLTFGAPYQPPIEIETTTI